MWGFLRLDTKIRVRHQEVLIYLVCELEIVLDNNRKSKQRY